MCGFFNSNRNRQASIAINSRGRMRSTRSQNRRIVKTMMYDNKTKQNKEVEQEIYVTKQQSDAMDLGFTGYSLKHQDILILGDPEDILPIEFLDDHFVVRNHVFSNIKCHKVGLFYSLKRKLFMILGFVNDEPLITVLFKSQNYHDLSHKVDLDNLFPTIEIKENVNRLICSIYNTKDHEILDLTDNPVIHYGINEIFKK